MKLPIVLGFALLSGCANHYYESKYVRNDPTDAVWQATHERPVPACSATADAGAAPAAR